MDLDRRASGPAPSGGLSFPAKVALGGLALFGVITVVQWVILSALRFIQFGLFVAVVVAIGVWAVSAKANR